MTSIRTITSTVLLVGTVAGFASAPAADAMPYLKGRHLASMTAGNRHVAKTAKKKRCIIRYRTQRYNCRG